MFHSSTRTLLLTISGKSSLDTLCLNGELINSHRQLVNCNQLDFYLDQTCNPKTIVGNQFLALHSRKDSSNPTFRRITFDIEGDTSAFVLRSFHASTKPIVNGEYAAIVYCGWTVEDQYNVGVPSFCHHVELFGSEPFLLKVDVNAMDLAYMVFGGVLNYKPPISGDQALSASKGAKPVEFQIDDIDVCVPDV
jgi:hypothetical protein